MAATHRARKRIREAKRKARPELATREMWLQNDYLNTFDLSWEQVEDGLERVSVHEVSPKEFIQR
jgi:histone arginine demethylase JMJD6